MAVGSQSSILLNRRLFRQRLSFTFGAKKRHMKQYILFIHGNAKTMPSEQEWNDYCELVGRYGVFTGGSQIGERTVIGDTESTISTDHIVGYMRFDSDDREVILNLLESHPVVTNGGSVELCEMPHQE